MSQGMFYADGDGVDHVRIDAVSKTRLGRYLANTARTPFRVPVMGDFESLEGYWQFLSTGCRVQELHKVYGRSALLMGHSSRRIERMHFRDHIVTGLKAKIIQSPCLGDLLQENTLPFALYELDDNGDPVSHHDWFIKALDSIVKDRPWLKHPRVTAPPSLSSAGRTRWTETVEK